MVDSRPKNILVLGLSQAQLCRLVVAVVVLISASVGGTYTAVLMNVREHDENVLRFNGAAMQSLGIINNFFANRQEVTIAIAKTMNYYQLNETAWPNVLMPGFYDTAPQLRSMLRLDNIAFVPIVQPSQLFRFENFMYDYFDSEPAIPPDAGIQPFGRGVYATNPKDDNLTYHDTTGITLHYHSANRILTPVLQLLTSTGTNSSQYAFNIHSNFRTGSAIDRIIACSAKYNYTIARESCGWLSNSLALPAVPSAPGLPPNDFASAALTPIYLHQNSSRLVGFIGTSVSWHTILTQTFTSYGGFDIVISSEGKTFTFSVAFGNATLRGVGDLHDSKYDRYRRAVYLAPTAHCLLANNTPDTVYLYPTETFFNRYRTQRGNLIGIAVGLIVALLGAALILYDVLMRRVIHRKAKMLDSKRRFVRFISHEIRTPLNSVHLGLELLVEELKSMTHSLLPTATDSSASSEADASQLLVRVRESLAGWLELAADLMGNSESAVDVLNDLLNYDKIEMGTLRLDFATVPVWPLVEKCVQAFAMQAKQKDITLHHTGPLWTEDESQERVVIGDRGRIAQIMRNLLSNALKFTPTCGSISVIVDWMPSGLPLVAPPLLPADQQDLGHLPRAGSIHVSVQDSGVGLSSTQLTQICSEGTQFNANKLQSGQGSGLGLFLSRGLAEQHCGSLTVTSKGLGQGSTFVLELPLYQRPAPTLPIRAVEHTTWSSQDSPHSESPTASSEPRRRTFDGRRVLVVDDAVSNRKMLMRLLKARGFVCEQAEDGQQAIDVYSALQAGGEVVDTIVMDYEMPVMNGPTATRTLRQMGCSCLIVGVTGNLLPDDVQYFKQQGADAVLGKPLNVKAFEEILHDFQI